MTDIGVLADLVQRADGIDGMAAYLEIDPAVVAVALGTPPTAATNRVARMVEENTRKLLLMPSQGGFFWRLTRKRVAKDWHILAKQGLHALPALESHPSGDLSDEQKERLDLIAKVLAK